MPLLCSDRQVPPPVSGTKYRNRALPVKIFAGRSSYQYMFKILPYATHAPIQRTGKVLPVHVRYQVGIPAFTGTCRVCNTCPDVETNQNGKSSVFKWSLLKQKKLGSIFACEWIDLRPSFATPFLRQRLFLFVRCRQVILGVMTGSHVCSPSTSGQFV